ncbi:MAG: hypothetical protein ACRDLN_09440 [Solirubrobacteraceae bacterium]
MLVAPDGTVSWPPLMLDALAHPREPEAARGADALVVDAGTHGHTAKTAARIADSTRAQGLWGRPARTSLGAAWWVIPAS